MHQDKKHGESVGLGFMRLLRYQAVFRIVLDCTGRYFFRYFGIFKLRVLLKVFFKPGCNQAYIAVNRMDNIKMSGGESWRLLRYGDRCVVNYMGVEYVVSVHSIIRLSNGRVLIRVMNEVGAVVGLFYASQVKPYNKDMLNNGLTSFELLLKKFEPKGMSTACCLKY